MYSGHIIIVPFHLPWNRSADYQKQTCLELAKNNTVIAYIYNDARFVGKRKPSRQFDHIHNMVFYQPTYILPFRRFAFIEQANQLINLLYLAWRYGGGIKRVIVWIFDPIFWFYPLVRFGYPRLVSLYDCVDYVWSSDVELRRRLQSMEKVLITSADNFFVNSHVLERLHVRTRMPTALVPQGFRIKEFMGPTRAPRIFSHEQPIVGYVGSIDHRIDFALVEKIIKDNPQWTFVLWGPAQETELPHVLHTQRILRHMTLYPNVIVGTSADKSEMPPIIAQFDVGIVPYDTALDAVRYSFPMKLFEYFYMGKPVVSTPVEELLRFPKFVRIGCSASEWERIITNTLSKRWPRTFQKKQRELARQNSWERKIAAIVAAVDEPDRRG